MGRFPAGWGVLVSFGALLCALLFSSCASTDSTLTGQAAHGTYSTFSAPEAGFTISDGWIEVSDTAVYRTAWYSANGTAWQPFNLSGSPYRSYSSWISGSAYSFVIPRGFAAPGEHYLIVYSCTNVSNTWDCHGNRWQLQIVKEPYARVYLDKGSDCGDVLDYQCGSRSICGSVADFGDCPSGYDCADNLCIARDDLTCDGVTCDEGEYCSRGVCLLSVPGETYFVALWGNDSWSGNFTHPFFTWQKPVGLMRPGDIAYFRGGVWQPAARPSNSRIFGLLISGPTSYNTAVSGTAEAPIRYFNYPGEKPILDGEFISPDEYQWSSGIAIDILEYISLKGLTVRHIHQTPPDFSHGKPYSEVYGIGSSGANMHFENVVVHDIDGRGFQHWSYAWTAADAEYAVELCLERQKSLPKGGNPASCTYPTPLFSSDNTTWINCDAYNLFDRYSSGPGNAADGWKVGTYYGGYFTWEGCRAWNYSDDGFDPHGAGYRIFKGCWAASFGKYENTTPLWGMEGNGFKMTGVNPRTVPGYTKGEDHFVRVENSIAAYCPGSGIVNNIVVGSQGHNGGLLYNNFAYRDSIGYTDSNASTYRNNIVYDSQDTGPIGEKYEIAIGTYDYTESNNTWVAYHTSGSSWPWWKYNTAFNVTDEDFVSLDATQLMRPRKADGSLPDITFGHLAQGSDLIDGGMVVPGYHCATAGDHPGEDCRVWYGAAPDLGPFEYQE